MKKITSTLYVLILALLCFKSEAQYVLLDNMEGAGICSGRWSYFAGANATGNVLFNVPNPSPSGLNISSHVAKFTKDTTCFAYMSTSCSVPEAFDLSSNSVFRMLVYSNTTEEVMFKLQPGNDYTKAVYFTYKIKQLNRWEEASFDFQSVKNRTDFNRIVVQFIDGRKANGILYFDLVQAPNPKGITLPNISIPMGHEDGTIIPAKLIGDTFQTALNSANWVASNLPPGVSIGNVQRINDSVANIVLSGNSPANYSRTVLKLSVSGQEILHPNTAFYQAKGNIVFEGNPNWTLVYNDEFHLQGKPDRTKWTIDPKPKGWINGEQQVYTDSTHDNIRVEDGHLIITGKKDFPNGNTTEPWSSGRLISQGKMDFLYGRVEVSAKLPKARGSWPAIWLMPTSSVYGGWPRSGEIDIMEHVGNNFGNVLSTLHTQNSNWMNGGHLTGSKRISDADTVFHNYILEWAPDSIRFIYDSANIYTYRNPHTDWKDWPFDQKFHVILNLAIGGGMGGSIVEADWPDSMTVDYVRVYQKGLGTPVLDSIVVTPADLSFLPGKSQQYASKAYDQNGNPMSISPVWGITGAGNTITAGGLATLQSSGVITATATVDSATVSGSTNVNVRPTNYKPVPAKIEAEHSDNTNGCCTEPTSDVGGGLNVGYIGSNTWFEYDIDVIKQGKYIFQFRVAATSASSAKVMLDTTALTTVQFPVSGGWQKWITVGSAPVMLTKGKQTIRVQANSSGWNFNWIKIVPKDSIILNRIVVSPDTAKIIVGETKQFTATGYDINNDYVTIYPAPHWSITRNNNSVSQDGLLTTSTTGDFEITAAIDTLFGKAVVKIVPVPVLTRIKIEPDTALVPLWASYQFTATGYDQNDSIMPIVPEPVWSVTGAGNTIGANGIFTAGTNPGTYLVSSTSGSVSTSAIVTTAYTCTVSNKHEAESVSSYASGPVLQTCTDIGGGQNFTNLGAGNWFAYNTLNVPISGRYTISFRVSSTAPAKIKVGHGGLTFGTIDVPSTGGVWKTIKDTITLPALTYTGIHVESGTFKFNWFSIDNCATPPPVLTSVELSPDSIDLKVGQSYQFILTGYDENGEPMQIPTPVWAVSGAGNNISANGLLNAGSQTGTYTVTVNTGSFTKTATVTIFNTICTINNKYEAESASARASGPYLQTCTDIGGGQNFAGLYTGNWFAYNTLNVPAARVYTISIRVLSTAPARVGVGHAGTIFGTIDIPSTGGLWQTISDTMSLPALTYTGIHVQVGTFKFNWFSIDDCKNVVEEENMIASRSVQKNLNTEIAVETKNILYPNPTTGPVNIQFDKQTYRSARLMDVNGRLIKEWNIATGLNKLQVNIGFLKNGIYLLKLESDTTSKTVRVIKL